MQLEVKQNLFIMSEKMVMCINIETGVEVEMPEHVTKDKGWLEGHLNLKIKPELKKLSQKEVLVKIQDAKTAEEIDSIMEGEDRQQCINAATEAKNKLTTGK